MTDKEIKEEIANNNPGLTALKNEDTVNIGLVVLPDTPSTDSKITDCTEYIEINKQPLNDLCLTKIVLDLPNTDNGQYQAFVDMFQDATALAGNASNYLTGLRIHFGVDNVNRLCLFYQPVGLTKFINPNPSNPKENLFDVHPSNNYYTYNGAAFVKQTNSTLLRGYYEEYHKQLGIKHDGTTLDNHKKFEDTESFIFPFQEIFRVIRDNAIISSNKNKNIYIYNMIMNAIGRPLRHSAILAPDAVTPQSVSLVGSLAGTYADLVHLCPPHCHRIEVTLE